MRSHLPYVISLLLLWIWSPGTLTAQSLGPKSPQSIQPSPQKPLSDTKPLAFQKVSEQTKQIFFMDAQGKPRLLAPSQKFIVTEDTPESAHILIWQAPPDMDQNMILEIPKDFSSNMPIFKRLPPFPGDFRGVFINQPVQSANPFLAPKARKQPK
jgi:hypothetical protein